MLRSGFVKQDGTPNKSAFARALAKAAGDEWPAAKSKWERSVFRWTDHDYDGGLSVDHAELVATVLGVSPEILRPKTAVRLLAEQNEAADAAVERLTRVVERLESRVQRLEVELLGTQDVRRAPRSS